MGRLVAVLWVLCAAGLFILTAIVALGPKADMSGWIMALGSALATAICTRIAWRTWHETPAIAEEDTRRDAPAISKDDTWRPAAEIYGKEAVVPRATNQMTAQAEAPPATDAKENYPGAWQGETVALETQVDALDKLGLSLTPGRNIDDLLTSWSREEYETDPYDLLLFMYGSDVEAEPFGRKFCLRGYTFDAEALVEAGDYARALRPVVDITGEPALVTGLNDDFDINAASCTIRYEINGQDRQIPAKVAGDWVDPEAVSAFVRDIEESIGDGRRFWAVDNGQSAVLFFLNDAEAEGINRLRADTVTLYAST